MFKIQQSRAKIIRKWNVPAFTVERIEDALDKKHNWREDALMPSVREALAFYEAVKAAETAENAELKKAYRSIEELKAYRANMPRPCEYNERPAVFHRWGDYARVIMPSIMVGGHPGGQHWETSAIIELDDGTVRVVPADEIRFTDGGQLAKRGDMPV